MFDPFAGGRLVGDESRIAGEEWIDQDRLAGKVEAKGGMTIPGDLQWRDLELVGLWMARNDNRAALCRKAQLAMSLSRRFRRRANGSLCRFFRLPMPLQCCRRAAR
jgi:hypothetical protein